MKTHPLARHISVVTNISIAIVAMSSFFLSAAATVQLVQTENQLNYTAYLYAIIVDLGIAVFGLNRILAKVDGRPERWYAPWLVIIATGLTVTFNVLHAPKELLPQFIAAIPPLVLFACLEILLDHLTHAATHVEQSKANEQTIVEHVEPTVVVKDETVEQHLDDDVLIVQPLLQMSKPSERPLPVESLTKMQLQIVQHIQNNQVSTYQAIADGLNVAKSTVGSSLKPLCDVGLVKKNGDGRFHVQSS